MAAAVLRSCVASEVVSTVFSRPKRSGKREKKPKNFFYRDDKVFDPIGFSQITSLFHKFFSVHKSFLFQRFSFTSLFSPSNCYGIDKNKTKFFLEMSNF